MNFLIKILLLVASVILASCQSNNPEQVTGQVWRWKIEEPEDSRKTKDEIEEACTTIPPSLNPADSGCKLKDVSIEFPELTVEAFKKNFPQFEDPSPTSTWADREDSFGLVFSGGGTRSTSASIGQLRALDNLGWLQTADYVSAISGGSWAIVPYIYNKTMSDAEFFGSYTPPEDLTVEELVYPKGGFEDVITHSGLLQPLLKSWLTFYADETFSNSIGDIFLKDFTQDQRRNYFTGFDEDTDGLTKKIVRADRTKCGIDLPTPLPEHCYGTKLDFAVIPKNSPDIKQRPYLIIGATLQMPHRISKFTRDEKDIYPFEITPYYSGVPSPPPFYTDQGDRGKVGGGYVSSYLYDSISPSKVSSNTDMVTALVQRERHRFSLSDVVGTSGAAPQSIATAALKYLTLGLTSNIGFPEFYHWSLDCVPTRDSGQSPKDADELKECANEYSHGDGGNIDNIGLIPLLARQVRNIVVFVNTQDEFTLEKLNKWRDSSGQELHKINFLYSDLIDYFYCDERKNGFEAEKREGRCRNKVFHVSGLDPLIKAYEDDKNNELPLVHCQNMAVEENDFWNVRSKLIGKPANPGDDLYAPNICFVHLDRTEGWITLISENDDLGDEGKKIDEKKRPYQHIPHLWTFGEQFMDLQLIDLNARQVRATANLTAWSVCQSVVEILGALKISPQKQACSQ